MLIDLDSYKKEIDANLTRLKNQLQKRTFADLKEIGINYADFNHSQLDLLTPALKIFDHLQVPYILSRVPGALELPFNAIDMHKKYDLNVILNLACVIKGDSYHFEMVCQHSLAGLQKVSLKERIPMIYGILTVFNLEQAKARQHLAQIYAINALDLFLAT